MPHAPHQASEHHDHDRHDHDHGAHSHAPAVSAANERVVLTGFLLTVPFQQRFGDLDDYQRDLYLILVVLAVVATGLIVAPASLHRVMFRKRLKRQLVEAGDVLARLGLVALALTMAGSAMLVFDVVAGRAAGRIVGAAALVVLGGCWWLLPVGLVRHARTSGSDEKTATAPDHAGPGPS